MSSPATALTVTPLSPAEFPDIQGLVVRSYKMSKLRMIGMRITDAARMRSCLAALLNGSGDDVRFMNAEVWEQKPEYCLNVGFTAEGLRAAGISDADLQSFPPEFVQGAVKRAAMVGDTGHNDPSQWLEQFRDESVHAWFTLWTYTDERMDSVTARFRQSLANHGGAEEAIALDGSMPEDERAHFNYVDGISQPHIAGVTGQKFDAYPDFPDPSGPVPPGAFLVGYESQHPGLFYAPAQLPLGRNGSFAAVRVLKQDCAAFEEYLDAAAAQTGMDRELVAGKLVGRMRDGTPLALAPEDATDVKKWNDFDYSDDPKGQKCPFGSHIRRAHPRKAGIAGGGGSTHRIMRRGLPYGPKYPHTSAGSHPDDGIERGLLGIFICGSLSDQFEFLMQDWMQTGGFTGVGRDRDPILGNQEGGPQQFQVQGPTKPNTCFRNLPSFVTTRGGAYIFLPSLSALRTIAAMGS